MNKIMGYFFDMIITQMIPLLWYRDMIYRITARDRHSHESD